MNILRFAYLALIIWLTELFGEGAQLGLTSFLIPSILMGIGVAIDVFIATTVKFRDQNLSWKNWTLPVTITHVAFPAVGYFLFWSLSGALPVAKILLGLTGFILVALFVYEVIAESASITPVFGISHWIGNLLKLSDTDARLFVTILAVSWDALWSGPAKAAQAVAGNWTSMEVILSFAIAGLVVAITAELALLIAGTLRKNEFRDSVKLSKFNLVGKYVELSVIGGFGVLSLWHSFDSGANIYASIGISAFIILLSFIFMLKPIWKKEMAEAKEAMV